MADNGLKQCQLGLFHLPSKIVLASSWRLQPLVSQVYQLIRQFSVASGVHFLQFGI